MGGIDGGHGYRVRAEAGEVAQKSSLEEDEEFI